jgi:peptidoglycan/LPS O-acetylase OafA/YrhL
MHRDAEASAPPPSRIPSLDGLRAVSIVMVLVAHAVGASAIPRASLARWGAEKCGELGVKVFFVISGFLITSLLLEELGKRGEISLRGFYVRRAFRIFPAYYVYLAIVFALSAARVFHLHPSDALFAVTYTMNYHTDRGWNVGHAWSLSVEEQFYLLWPFVIAAAGPRRGARVAIAVMILGPVARGLSFALQRHLGQDVGIGQTFPTVADALATGCLLALGRERIQASVRYNALLRSRWFWLVPLAGLAALVGTRVLVFGHLVGQTVLNLAVGVTVDRVVRVRQGMVFRFLNLPPVVVLGTLSYSIYLWQQPFLNPELGSPRLPLLVALPLLLAVAWASYNLVEKPCLRARGRIEGWLTRRSAARPIAPSAA